MVFLSVILFSLAFFAGAKSIEATNGTVEESKNVTVSQMVTSECLLEVSFVLKLQKIGYFWKFYLN
jgi:hypothetical protein